MGEHRLGGECRLDRLLRVQRTEQVDGGSLVPEFLLGGVGVGGGEGVDQRMQDVVGEDRVERSPRRRPYRRSRMPPVGSGAGEGWSWVAVPSAAAQGRKQAATSSWVTSRWSVSRGGGEVGRRSGVSM